MFSTERPKYVDPSTVQNLTSSGTAAETTAIAATHGDPLLFIRLAATAAVYVYISAAGTDATSVNGFVIPAGGVETVRISRGHIVSVIQVTAGGIVSVAVIEP